MMLCPFCNKTLRPKFKINSSITQKEINYYACTNCKALIQQPYPDETTIQTYYENYQAIKEQMNPGYLQESQYLTFKEERLKTLNELQFPFENIANANNVELGCANGFFLRLLNELGSTHTTGIDISKTMLESIQLPQCRLINGSLADISGNSVDNLYLFNVLEHARDVEDLFAQAHRIMKNDAYLIIEVPVVGIIAHFHAKNWRFLMPDEHINIPSMKSVKRLLKKYGMKIMAQTRFGSGLTLGTCHPWIKKHVDSIVKRLHIGDRCAILIKKHQITK